MTDTQLYFAVGAPTLAVLISMGLNLLSIMGIRGDLRDINSDLRDIRADIGTIRTEITAITGRISKIEGKIEGGRVVVVER